jgi:hypothetical protein
MEGPDRISENVYYNEKLGLPYDSADRPITREEIIVACDNTANKKYKTVVQPTDSRVRHSPIWGGIDWGTGADIKSESGKKKHASYTVLSLMRVLPNGKKWPFFFKKYRGAQADPNFIRDDIITIHHHFGVTQWGVDWGFGWMMNNILFRDLPKKVIQFQYVPMQKKKRKWDPDGFKFQLNRSMVMSEFFTAIKRGEWQFPPWNEFEWVAQDILSIFNDYSSNPATRNQLFYSHSLEQPDDFAHSLILANEAYAIVNAKP